MNISVHGAVTILINHNGFCLEVLIALQFKARLR